jgi:hypothetical protein
MKMANKKEHTAVVQLEIFLSTKKEKRLSSGVYATREQVESLIAETFFHGYASGEKRKVNHYRNKTVSLQRG